MNDTKQPNTTEYVSRFGHDFDPGYTGLSESCNALVLDPWGCGITCGYPRADHVAAPVTSAQAYYEKHGWSGCAGTGWDRMTQAEKDAWDHAARLRGELDRIYEYAASTVADCRAWSDGSGDDWDKGYRRGHIQALSLGPFALPINRNSRDAEATGDNA